MHFHYSEYKTRPFIIHCADHGHKKRARRGVRGRMMWLTPSFVDRVKHGERTLNVPRSTSLCAWFVKQLTLVGRGRYFGRLRGWEIRYIGDRVLSLSMVTVIGW